MRTMAQRMVQGELYRADDPELRSAATRALALLHELDTVAWSDGAERTRLLRELLGGMGEGVTVRPGFRCDYGTQITIGAGTFVNFGCVMLDVAPITIGERCQLAPGVQLLAATHPVDPDARRAGWEYGRAITVGDNVWLGAGVLVGPGVTIAEDTVVGAGAVVTADLPAAVVAAGVPARVVRPIGPGDRIAGPLP